MRRIPVRVWTLAVVSALLQLLPFPLAGPVPLWRRFFCWFCLAPLLYGVLGSDDRGSKLPVVSAAIIGYVCGVFWYLGNCYWIYPTMHVYGALASPVAAGILVLFALYLGLYHAVFAAFVAWIHRSGPTGVALAAAPVVWVAVELARARITGFPWDLLGYTQIDNLALTRLAPWTGVMGLSLLVAAVNTLWLVRVPALRRWSPAPGVVAATLLAVAFTLLQTPTRGADTPTASATLLQDNLSVGAEAPANHESPQRLLQEFTSLSDSPSYVAAAQAPRGTSPEPSSGSKLTLRTDLVLWPEAPTDFYDGDPVFRAALSRVAGTHHAPVIADSVAVEQGAPEHSKLYNSASFFSPDGSYAGRYDKMHLVPFGEYTPYKQILFFAGHLLDNVGGFTPGSAHTLFRTGGHSYGVFICYESIFGDEIRELAGNGADVLINLSDDGWYGDSSAPWEHLDMARMRAIENHRWLLRSTNTGITASIDPEGRVVGQMPRHVRGSVLVPFGFESDRTFYTRHGDWVGWTCVVLTALALAWCRFTAPGRTKAIH